MEKKTKTKNSNDKKKVSIWHDCTVYIRTSSTLEVCKHQALPTRRVLCHPVRARVDVGPQTVYTMTQASVRTCAHVCAYLVSLVLLFQTSCSNESSITITFPSSQDLAGTSPTLIAARGGTLIPKCKRRRWFVGPQCRTMCVPGLSAEISIAPRGR